MSERDAKVDTEYLERTLKQQRGSIVRYIAFVGLEWINRATDAEKRAEEAEAACAAMRSALVDAKEALEILHPNMNPEEPCVIYEAWEGINKVLENTSSRALDELRALQKVADAAKDLLDSEDAAACCGECDTSVYCREHAPGNADAMNRLMHTLAELEARS